MRFLAAALAVALPSVEAFAACPQPLPTHNFSYDGYRQSYRPVPYKTRPATLSYPAGRHTITSFIDLASGQVLRGAGRDQTVLVFPNGLKGLGAPCNTPGVDCFDWGGGVVRMSGREVGVEDLTIEFPAHNWCHYCGNQNGGFNGMVLNDCTNCWVKNVTIRNADSGVNLEGGSYNTLDGVHVYANPPRSHFHISIGGFAHHNLVTNFRANGLSAHGLTGNWGVNSNVFANTWLENAVVEPDHNCNGVGGAASCSPNMMYSNITGKMETLQTKDRAGNTLPTVLWNVLNTNNCPVEAQAAQVTARSARGGGPLGHTLCASENGTCTVTGTRDVAFGASGKFYFRTVTGSVACNAATFGDPIAGVAKACYYTNHATGNTATIQENTTGFCTVNGTIDSNFPNFSGAGFANMTDVVGSGITYRVNVGAAGPYRLRWRFAAGSNLTRTARLLIDGAPAVQTIHFPHSGVWWGWTWATADLNLPAGVHAIRLESTTPTGLANIDWMDVTGTSVQAASCTTPITTTPAPVAVPSTGPLGYTYCAAESGTCSFSGAASVAYGASGQFNYRNATNSSACNSSTFSGDPIPRTPKACYYRLGS